MINLRETNLRKLSRSYHFIKGFLMLDFINNYTKNPFYSKTFDDINIPVLQIFTLNSMKPSHCIQVK